MAGQIAADIISLEFVTQAHQLGEGKASVLASLLGPSVMTYGWEARRWIAMSSSN